MAKTVSGIQSDNCHKMKHQGFWCDALFMHCLANSCQADVIIYNLDGPQTLVGSAIHGIETDLIVPVVLSEHYHWWAVIPAEKDPGAVQVVAKSWDIALRLCVACFLRSCFRHTSHSWFFVSLNTKSPVLDEASCQVEDDDDDYDNEVVEAARLDVAVLPLQEEIKLCECLLHWQPWSLPNPELVNAMQTHVFSTVSRPVHKGDTCRSLLNHWPPRSLGPFADDVPPSIIAKGRQFAILQLDREHQARADTWTD